jgi:hypothetical protein
MWLLARLFGIGIGIAIGIGLRMHRISIAIPISHGLRLFSQQCCVRCFLAQPMVRDGN